MWSPALTSARPLPVLVYLTGSLWSLDSTGRLAPKSLVAERNILVVTISSRVFFSERKSTNINKEK